MNMNDSSRLARLSVLALLTASPSIGWGGEAAAYIHVTIESGLQLICDPLQAPDSSVAAVLPGPPLVAGTTLYGFASGGFTTNTLVTDATGGLSWTDPQQALAPGGGAFLLSPTNQPVLVTFVGQVPLGAVTNVIPAGLSLVSGLQGVQGRLHTDMGLMLAPFDNVYWWEGGKYVVYTQLPDGTWYPAEPVIGLGEAFFIDAAQGTNWVTHLQ